MEVEGKKKRVVQQRRQLKEGFPTNMDWWKRV
jgi:hypothetical protein